MGLPLRRTGRHGWSKAASLVAPGVNPSGQYDELPRVRFQFYDGLENQVDVIQGAYPQPANDPQDTVEVMATQALADTLGLQVGDQFSVQDFLGSDNPQQVTARLSAIVQLRPTTPGALPAADTFTLSAFPPLSTSPLAVQQPLTSTAALYAPRFLDEALTVPEQSFFRNIALNFSPNEGEVTWIANYDETAVTVDNADPRADGAGLAPVQPHKRTERSTISHQHGQRADRVQAQHVSPAGAAHGAGCARDHDRSLLHLDVSRSPGAAAPVGNCRHQEPWRQRWAGTFPLFRARVADRRRCHVTGPLSGCSLGATHRPGHQLYEL